MPNAQVRVAAAQEAADQAEEGCVRQRRQPQCNSEGQNGCYGFCDEATMLISEVTRLGPGGGGCGGGGSGGDGGTGGV